MAHFSYKHNCGSSTEREGIITAGKEKNFLVGGSNVCVGVVEQKNNTEYGSVLFDPSTTQLIAGRGLNKFQVNTTPHNMGQPGEQAVLKQRGTKDRESPDLVLTYKRQINSVSDFWRELFK